MGLNGGTAVREEPRSASQSSAKKAGPRKLLSPLATVLVSVVMALVLGAMVFVVQLRARDTPRATIVASIVGVGTLVALLTFSFASRRVATTSRLLPWLVAMGWGAVLATVLAGVNYRESITDTLVAALIWFAVLTFLYHMFIGMGLPQARFPIFRLPPTEPTSRTGAEEDPRVKD
jgi:fluoride ion exporter CrcB/FEX